MEIGCQIEIKVSDFVLMKIILFSGGVANKIQKQLEEGSLMVNFILFVENSVENL